MSCIAFGGAWRYVRVIRWSNCTSHIVCDSDTAEDQSISRDLRRQSIFSVSSILSLLQLISENLCFRVIETISQFFCTTYVLAHE